MLRKPPIPMATYGVGETFGAWRVVSVKECDLSECDCHTLRYTAQCVGCGQLKEKSNFKLRQHRYVSNRSRNAVGCNHCRAHEIISLHAGQMWGNWRVVDGATVLRQGKNAVLCECQCQWHTQKLLSVENLESIAKSGKGTCGCSYNRLPKSPNHKHGGFGTPLYNRWRGYSMQAKSAEWQDFACFRDWAIAHEYQDGQRVLRPDTQFPLSPENCVFLAAKHRP